MGFFGFIFIILFILLFVGLGIILSLVRGVLHLFGLSSDKRRDNKNRTSFNHTSKQTSAETSSRKKIIDDDEGEYVEFEEVK